MTGGYATTAPLDARIAIHRYGTNPQSWYAFVRDRLPRRGRVLDAGGGTAALWDEGERPDDLVLVDHSQAMCATQRAKGHRTARASVDRLPFRDAAFDGALCAHVLYHVPEPRRGLAELHRVLRPGGWVAVATNGSGHMAELSDVAERVGLPRADVHEHFPAEAAPAALAERFTDVVAHRYDDTLVVPDVQPLVDYVASMLGAPMTPEQEAAVRAGAGRPPFRIRKHTVLVTARR